MRAFWSYWTSGKPLFSTTPSTHASHLHTLFFLWQVRLPVNARAERKRQSFCHSQSVSDYGLCDCFGRRSKAWCKVYMYVSETKCKLVSTSQKFVHSSHQRPTLLSSTVEISTRKTSLSHRIERCNNLHRNGANGEGVLWLRDRTRRELWGKIGKLRIASIEC